MKEYVINSKKYGRHVVLLDDEDYDRVVKERYSLALSYDKTIKIFMLYLQRNQSVVILGFYIGIY